MTDWDGPEDAAEFRRLVEDIITIIGPPAKKSDKNKPSHKLESVQMPVTQPEQKPLESGIVIRDTLQDSSKGPEMVVIQPGWFDMGDIWGDGDTNERPAHTVHIFKPFALGRYPVTFDQYAAFITATGRDLPSDSGWGRGSRPVINVSWEDAMAYAEWLSRKTGKYYRLPSEAEWEYAARSGGKEEKWAGTSVEGELGDYAWYYQNSGGTTHPVGEKKPNGLGLYDMSGNVWEWVADYWHDGYSGAPDDGSVWRAVHNRLRVVRGGSRNGLVRAVRSAYRFRHYPDYRHYDIGFRLAQDL